jgi:hypothetical protein
MTLKQIKNAVDGFEEQREKDFQNDLIAARIIAYYAVSPYLGKKSKVKKPSDLFPIDSDGPKNKKGNKTQKLKPVTVTIIPHG